MSAIEWTDRTWNPTRGCSRVSPGCEHCYAMRQARRFDTPGGPYEGLTRVGPHGVDWSGRARLVPEMLDQPLRWRRPRRVFVDSMSDLFHESLPDEAIDQVFAVMALAPQHSYQVLTKRARRMSTYLNAVRFGPINDAARTVSGREHIAVLPTQRHGMVDAAWPLPNVMLGVSAEDQQRADERIPDLLATPAAVRFVSAEPLLGPIDLASAAGVTYWDDPSAGIHWLICGGESGPGARPSDVVWFRSLRDQCREAGVPFFMKQLGARPYERRPDVGQSHPEGWTLIRDEHDGAQWYQRHLRLHDSKGGDPAEWPHDLRIREFPPLDPRAP